MLTIQLSKSRRVLPYAALSLLSTTMAYGQIGPRKPLECPQLRPTAPIAYDVDEDGLDDVVYVDIWQRRLDWTRSLGQGSFAPPATIAIFDDEPELLRLADFDGDGDPDFVVVLGGRQIAVVERLSTGFRTLARRVGPELESIVELALADVDGDGDLDALVSRHLGDGVSDPAQLAVLLSNGAGAFGPERTVAAWPTNSSLSIHFAAEDLDGDGAADLVVGYDSRVEYFESAGSASFRPPVVLDQGPYWVSDIVIADLDQDGISDVIASRSSVRTYRGLGGGAFQPPVQLDRPGPLSVSRELVARDADGDGDCDLFLHTTREVELFEAMGDGTFATATRLTLTPPGENPSASGIAVAELTGDALLDIVLCETAFGPVSTVNLYAQAAGPETDSFEAAVPLTYYSPIIPVVGTVNLDGDDDVEVVNARRDVDGTLTVHFPMSPIARDSVDVHVPNLAGISAMAAADLDEDGREDLLFVDETQSLVVVPSLGGGSFAPLIPVTAASPDVQPRLADMNGDGHMDVVYATPNLLRIHMRLGVGDGTFSNALTVHPNGDRIEVVRLTDMDGDGRLDVIVGGVNGVWYRQNLASGFTTPVRLSRTSSNDAFGVVAVDWNADGRLDVFWAGSLGVYVALSAPDGGSFEMPSRIQGGASFDNHRFEVADVDGDGAANSIVSSGARFGTLSVPELDLERFSGFGTAAFGSVRDLDGDGDLDIIYAQGTTHEVVIRENFVSDSIGTPRCTPSIPHASGVSAEIRAYGSVAALDNDVTLVASGLRTGPALFLASQTFNVTFPVQNSRGRLCLGGSIGRFVGPGQINVIDGGSGSIPIDRASVLRIDTGALPSSAGFTAATPGATWYFQLWYRDLIVGVGASSNFTDALELTFR